MSTNATHTSRDLVPYDRDAHVSGHCLRAESPLVLPSQVCARCGSTEQGGTIRSDVVTYVNPWIWLTAFISWIITWIAYVATRKRITVQYYLCPDCADKRKIRTTTSRAVSLVSLVGVVAVLFAGEAALLAPFIAALTAGSIGLLISARPALRATSHDDGVFLLKGASPEVLRTMQRKQLPDAPERANH